MKYGLRHAWSDGTTAVITEPLDLLARLAALVPAPGRHLPRYHGMPAPNAAWRKRIVPKGPEAERKPSGAGESARGVAAPTRIPWTELLRRVFAKDVLECPRCRGRMKIIATVTDPEAVRKILACIGLPARPPPIAPAREWEQAELGFEG